jgi:hypothetical protein
MALNDTLSLETLWQKTASLNHRYLLLETIETVFKDAIKARAPKMRPPGKAGLRAEKSYYRLLYLEGEFKSAFSRPPSADSEKTGLPWDQMNTILGQLTDIPELQSEITSAIARALVHIQERASGGG